MAMTMRVFSSCLASLLVLEAVESANVQFNPVESLFNGGFVASPTQRLNSTRLHRDPHAPTPEQREAERMARRERTKVRNERVKEAMKYFQPDTVERVSEEDMKNLRDAHPSLRKLWGNSDNSIQYADPGDDYDMWQQAYRMLGGFIDCDNKKGEGSHDSGDNGGGGRNDGACSRWMLWASYIDPNYQGNGYDEYFGDEPTGTLDCHNPNSDWILLGIYRQEFYQYIEQISKHLWAIDDYNYVVALAGLAYMTDEDCFYVGNMNDGTAIYAGVAPKPYGKFEMALYTDGYCLTPNENTGYNFDDFGLYSDIKLESHDGDDGGGAYDWAYEWWQDTQEYTLEQLNDVYEPFKYCTSCIDYPTYQDGYVIGDSGMDDDDLINQCWKFYSHDSFPCESDCIAKAHAQGTILSVTVSDKIYGESLSDFYEESVSKAAASGSRQQESKFSRMLANVFVTFSFIVFVATFLAFAVARRSRYRESRSAKSRRLLDDDGGRSPRSRSSKGSRRSKSRSRKEEGDGLFRSSGRNSSSRSKSKSRSSKQRSRSRGGSDRDEEYEPPQRSRRSSSRGRRKDDF